MEVYLSLKKYSQRERRWRFCFQTGIFSVLPAAAAIANFEDRDLAAFNALFVVAALGHSVKSGGDETGGGNREYRIGLAALTELCDGNALKIL